MAGPAAVGGLPALRPARGLLRGVRRDPQDPARLDGHDLSPQAMALDIPDLFVDSAPRPALGDAAAHRGYQGVRQGLPRPSWDRLSSDPADVPPFRDDLAQPGARSCGGSTTPHPS